MDDSELNDPGSDLNSPDPLLGEQAQSGALSVTGKTSTPPTQAGARANAKSRYEENEAEMADLRGQYATTSKVQSDQYAQQKKLLEDATNRLMNYNAGPGDQESAYRVAAAMGAPGSFNIGRVNETRADILKEQRESELAKQQLIAQYQGQAVQAGLGQSNAKLSQLTQQQRIVAGQLNSSGNQQFRGQTNMPWYVKDQGDGTFALQPGAEKIMDQQAMSHLFGRFTLLPQPDGSKKIVPLGSILPQPGAAAPKPAAPAPAAAPPQAPAPAPAAPTGAPPNAAAPPAPQAQTATRSPYDDLFLPSTVLSPTYGALTPQTKPAYVATAQQAFDPNYFSEYQWHPTVIGDDKIRLKQIEKMSEDQGAAAQGAEQTIYNYGNALGAIDSMGNDQKLLSGPAGQKIGAFENTMRGILGDDLTGKITNDPELKKLATQQDTDKYFLNAATSGLKAIYGGRITNMEVQQRLKSLPSNNLMPAVMRMLASAQAEVAQDAVNRSKVWSVYKAKNGDPDPARFNTWYEANFSPFHQSRLKANLQTQQQAPAVAAAPVNPLVAYYTAVAKARAAGQPPPPKPPGL